MIDVSPEQLQTIKDILKHHVPGCEVRAFGSRFTWTAKDYSDLDLAIVGTEKLSFKDLSALRTAFEESDLPYRVDVLDWHAISLEIQRVIEQAYEVIQKPESGMSFKGWNTWKVGEIGRIVTGKTPPTQNLKNFGNRYPFITPRDMLGQKRIQKTERYLSEEGKNAVRNCLLPAKSVCVSCIGSDMGKVVMTTTDSVTNQQLNSITCNTSFDPDFVYYALVHISDELRNAGHSSTAVPILNKTDFSNFEITAPDIVTQRRIADILSALDEKIELNRLTNATLEAIAQAIFKEWFFDFNFPGATGEMVESALGMIPRGWRVGKLGGICEFAYGKGLKSENRAEGVYPVVGSNGIVGTHSEYLVDGPGIVIGRKGTIGEVIWIHNDFFPIDTTFYMKDLLGVGGLYFHYFLLKGQDFKKIASDSAVPGLNRNQAYDNLIVIPTPDVIKRFNEIAFAIFENITNDEQQSTTLAAIRDALLPKLMNGEIPVGANNYSPLQTTNPQR